MHDTVISPPDTGPDAPDRPEVIDRRQLFRRGAQAALVAAAGGAVWTWRGRLLEPFAQETAQAATIPPMPAGSDVYIGGTDGWMSLPRTPAIAPFHPDTYAPAPYSTYIFGFRNITELTDSQRADQKNHAQHSAPLFWVRQHDPGNGVGEFRVSITNLGLAQRPDLFDEHTLHWHGFRNVIPFFDGEPTGSVAVPGGSVFTYVYRPHEPGTYMYHCHVEDTEHVHMGMTGMVFVRPRQDGTPYTYGGKTFTAFAYNDGDGSTGYDREFSMMLTEVWAESHWADAHIQLPEWSDYRADFSMINGRVHPDTLAPNAPIDLTGPTRPYLPVLVDGTGDLQAPAGRPDLNRQPLSALVQCNAGDDVLLRFANLGFKEVSMTTTGLSFRVVGRDATPMRNADGTDTSYTTNTLVMGAGESFDVILRAPAHSGGAGADTYLLYNRSFQRSDNGAPGGYGGQTTEIRVHPTGTLPAQRYPNY